MTAQRMRLSPEEELSAKQDSVYSEIFAVFMISYAFMSFGYEKYMPAPFMEIWNKLMLIIYAVTWLYFSFKNGRKKRIAFPVFTVLFFGMPEIFIYLSNYGPTVFRMSVPIYVISEFSLFMANAPVKALAREPDEGAHVISSAVCAALYLAVCWAGYLTTLKGKNKYAPKRMQ